MDESVMSDLQDLQERAGAWHLRRFPDALEEHVALKVCSEAGEVADAVIDQAGHNRNRNGDIVYESADLLNAILALVGRYHSSADLLTVASEILEKHEKELGEAE